MATRYIPTQDAELRAFATTLAATVSADPPAYGMAAGDGDALTNATNALAAALPEVSALQAATRAAVTNKNALRAALEATIRPRVAQIQANPAMTPTVLEAAGLPVHDTTPSDTAPMVPARLVCTPLGSGVNRLSWKRNGNLPRTLFDIEAKHGTASEYTHVFTVTTTKYDDVSPAGAAVVYRVRARRGKLVSTPSNEAGVW